MPICIEHLARTNNHINFAMHPASPAPPIAGNQTTVSQVGPDELPPAYQQGTQNGVPMVTCRVCQAMIDISTKREQHVVKCNQCSEATVCVWQMCAIGLSGHHQTIMLFHHASQFVMRRPARSTCAVRATAC